MNSNLSLLKVMLGGVLLVLAPHNLASDIAQLHIASASGQSQHERTPLVIICEGDHPQLIELSEQLRRILECSGHSTVRVVQGSMPRQRTDIARYFTEGEPFVLYLCMQRDEEVVHGRLYDTLDVIMIQGTRWARRPTLRGWAQSIAHDIWRALFGTSSSFLSSIAYIKRTTLRHGAVQSELCIAAWDGAEARTVLRRPAILLAPVWLRGDTSDDGTRQILFSEFTPTNVRLMKSDESGHVRVVFDYGGTTVGASVTVDKGMVYCRSGVIWHHVFDASHHMSIHRPIIREKEPCACPIALQDGDVIYGVQGVIKRWQRATGQSSVLVGDRFCTAPAVCEAARLLVYSGRVKQQMQLFIAALDGSQARQITSGVGDKSDPTISPCGTFVAYCHTEGKVSRIYILNLLTQMTVPITAVQDYCLCPAWSS